MDPLRKGKIAKGANMEGKTIKNYRQLSPWRRVNKVAKYRPQTELQNSPWFLLEKFVAVTLLYKGPLLAVNDRDKRVINKQVIRRSIHGQLANLWRNPPMDIYTFSARGRTFKVGRFTFEPLISKLSGAACELNIKLLTRGKLGNLIHGADLDNRLKTLFDALRLPNQVQELPPNDKPSADENPFYVLLEDDAQITHLSVKSEPLLSPPVEGENETDVHLDIEVKVKRPNEF